MGLNLNAMLIKIILILILSELAISNQVFAQYNLEITGIMQGEEPLAVVDGKVVKKGDKIGEIEIVAVGRDFVHFKIGDETVTRYLAKIEKTVVSPVEKNKNIEQNYSMVDYKAQTQLEENIQKAQEYVDQADNLLKEQKVMSVKKYSEVLSLYDKSEREFQYAFEKPMDNEYRKRISTSIRILRDGKVQLTTKKRDFEEEIEKAIDDHRVVLGMTKNDVIRSLGNPNEGNSSNYQGTERDQWIYGKTLNGKYLYFDDGMLTSTQQY